MIHATELTTELANEVLERRNEALQILHDTVIDVESASRDELCSILCKNLVRISKAQHCLMSVFDNNTQRVLLTAEARQGPEKVLTKHLNRNSCDVSDDFIASCIQEKIVNFTDKQYLLPEIFIEKINEWSGRQSYILLSLIVCSKR